MDALGLSKPAVVPTQPSLAADLPKKDALEAKKPLADAGHGSSLQSRVPSPKRQMTVKSPCYPTYVMSFVPQAANNISKEPNYFEKPSTTAPAVQNSFPNIADSLIPTHPTVSDSRELNHPLLRPAQGIPPSTSQFLHAPEYAISDASTKKIPTSPSQNSVSIPAAAQKLDVPATLYREHSSSPAIVDSLVENIQEPVKSVKSPGVNEPMVSNPFENSPSFNVVDDVSFAANSDDFGVIAQVGDGPNEDTTAFDHVGEADSTPETYENSAIVSNATMPEFEEIDTNPRKYGLFSRTVESTERKPAAPLAPVPTADVDDLTTI
ncbi:hypothetical protein BC829DRAFT_204890 [Chytridium lagenaria]|nr:hypothetical protein BC829DRAFT_204890 [Chytridium lagenaria]